MRKHLLLGAFLLGGMFASSGQVLLNENFDGATFPPTGWTTANTHATKNWIRITGENAFNGAGTAAVNWDAGVQDESLISPAFSLAGMTSAYLNFTAIVGFEWMVTNDNGDLNADISTDGGTTWTTLWNEDSEGTFEDYEPFLKNISLSAYLGETNVKIRFRYLAQDADIVRLDDVSVTGCAPISGLQLTELADDAITFEWDGVGSGYNIEYGLEDFELGSGISLTSTTGTIEIDELEAGTGYDVYIQSNCGGTAVSGWEGPFTVFTTLSTPTTVPYSYGFDAGTLGSAGWTTVTVAQNGGAWGMFTGVPQAGTGMAALVGAAQTSDAWLFSRGLYLVGGTDVTITYFIREAALVGTPNINNLQVSIGQDNTPEAQSTVLGTFNDYNQTTYTQQTHTFSVPETDIYYLGFHSTTPAHTAASNGAILVDSVVVTGETFGTNDALSSQFSVYPNPATNVINIANAENILVNGVEIVDINGRTVKSVKFDNVSEAQINISDLASGMYLMNISSDKGTTTKKIVKN